jgi:pimeloyl-ACP methyl ester carboxylesterase
LNRLDRADVPSRRSAAGAALRAVLILMLWRGGALLIFTGLQRSLIYVPYKGPVPLRAAGPIQDRIRELRVPTTDGISLHGWVSKSPQNQSPDEKYLVILFPGNAGHRAFRAPILNDFNDLGCDCLICDYRGYSENAGRPSEEAFAKDAQAIWNYARQELHFPPERIILCGESLGGGVATRLAWELTKAGAPPAGLILRTTFTSLTDTAQRLYPYLPVRLVLVDRYPSITRIPEITCPLLVIHGKRDRIVPFEQGKRLFDAAPEKSDSGIPKTFLALPDSGHNDLLLTADGEIHAAHRQFLEALRRTKREN